MNTHIMDHNNITNQPINISKVEHHYDATFIGDFCVKERDGYWTEFAIPIFYQPNPDVGLGHSHYFGIIARDGSSIIITRGDSAFDEPITGVVADNGEIIFSRYRHHYITSQDQTVWIDGGRDYCRSSGSKNGFVTLIIDKDHLIIDPESITNITE